MLTFTFTFLYKHFVEFTSDVDYVISEKSRSRKNLRQRTTRETVNCFICCEKYVYQICAKTAKGKLMWYLYHIYHIRLPLPIFYTLLTMYYSWKMFYKACFLTERMTIIHICCSSLHLKYVKYQLGFVKLLYVYLYQPLRIKSFPGIVGNTLVLQTGCPVTWKSLVKDVLPKTISSQEYLKS